MPGPDISKVFLMLSSRDMFDIVKYLLDNDVVLFGELADALGIRNRGTLRKRLAKLVEGGIVNRVGKGRYTISRDIRGVIREFMVLSELFRSRDRWVIKDGSLIPLSDRVISEILSPYEVARDTLSRILTKVSELANRHPYPYIEWELLVSFLISSLFDDGLYDLADKVARNNVMITNLSRSPHELLRDLKESARFKCALNSFRESFYNYIFGGKLSVDKYSAPWEVERIILGNGMEGNKDLFDLVSYEVLIDLLSADEDDIQRMPDVVSKKGVITSLNIGLEGPSPELINKLWMENRTLILDVSDYSPSAKSRREWKRLFNLLRNKEVILSNDKESYVFSDGLAIPRGKKPIYILGRLSITTNLLSDEANVTGIVSDFIDYLSKKRVYDRIIGDTPQYYAHIIIDDILEHPVTVIKEKARFVKEVLDRVSINNMELNWVISGGGKRRFSGKVNLEIDWLLDGGVSPMTYRVLDEDDLMMAVTQLVGTGYRYLKLLW
jgi:hypothetical protein